MTATSLSFTEEMKGFFDFDVDDPETGHRQGELTEQRLMFHLTITIDDVDSFATDPMRPGSCEGYVEADALGGRLPVERGWFNLFLHDDDPTHRLMKYRLHFADGGGNPLTLTGFKDVRDDEGLDVWSDTSTLYVRLLAGHVEPDGDDAARVLGAGVLRILLLDFARQLTTFRTEGPDGARAAATFGRIFAGELWDVFVRRGGTEAS